MADSSYNTFEDIKARLDEIVGAIDDENLSLDEALSLYEEAVSIGLRASDLLEENIETQRHSEQNGGQVDGASQADACTEEGPAGSDASHGSNEVITA